MTAIATAGRDLIGVTLLLLSGFGLGAAILPRPRMAWWAVFPITSAIGLGVISFALFLVGAAGKLGPMIVLVILVPGLSLAVTRVTSFFRRARMGVRPGTDGGVRSLLLVVTAISLLVSLCGSLVPEWFYDALCYKTAIPQLHLIRGRIDVFPNSTLGSMPAAVNLLFMPLLVLGDAGTAKTLHWAFLVCSCLLVANLATAKYGALSGAVAACLFSAIPGVAVVAGLGGVDLAIVFFVLGGLTLLDTMSSIRFDPRLYLASGILLGTAAASTYNALGIVGLLLVTHFSCRFGQLGTRSTLIHFAGVGLAVVVIASPWYVRNAAAFGDPVYPLLASDGSPEAVTLANLRRDAAAPKGISSIVRAPLSLLSEDRRLGAGDERFPISLILTAGLFWGLSRKGFSRRLGVLLVVLVLYWSATAHMFRFLYPGLALAAILASGLLVHSGYPRRSRCLGVVLVVLLSIVGTSRHLAIQQQLFGGPWFYLLGIEPRESFLEARVRNYPVARWVSLNTSPEETKILFLGETSGYYYRRNYEPQSWIDPQPVLKWMDEFQDASQLSKVLRTRGFTHAVWDSSQWNEHFSGHNQSESGLNRARVEELVANWQPLIVSRGIWLFRIPDWIIEKN